MIWLLLLNATFSCIMSGVIWFVQVVHYPLLGSVDANSFIEYQKQHVRRTGNLVGPLMMIEIVASISLAVGNICDSITYLIWLNLGILLFIWFSTFLIQIPLHNKLLLGFDKEVHRRLVQGNWLRTLAWTVKMILSLILIKKCYDGCYF
ncbi:MAG: hypothetical protein VX294_11055 [Candidatus Latescibacterota bacterium]|nr:hypothetical protein [Candidatus Latescibacterota bacterium]